MKKAVLSLLLAACCGTALAQKKEYGILSVAFYNLENLFHPSDDPYRFDEDFTPKGDYNYTEEIYKQKLHNLAFALSKIGTELTPEGPAFIGIAEVENDLVIKDLLAQPELEPRKWKYVWFEGPDMRGIDVGFLYNPKYFKLLGANALRVDLRDGGDVKAGGTRDVLHVTGVLGGSDTVHVLVNHWPSRRGGEAASAPLRAIAAGVGKRIVDSLNNMQSGARVFIMGDLNDDPVSPSVTKVLGAVGDKNKVKRNGLFNPWVKYYKNGIGTLAYQDSWNLFDQIILSEPLIKEDPEHWRFLRAEVFNREFLIQKTGHFKGYAHRSFSGTTWLNGYSDHFPTVVYLVKPLK